jgi:hypothetical protein
MLSMAEAAHRLKRGPAGGKTKSAGSAYGFVAAGARLSLIVPLTLAGGGLATPNPGALAGIAVETFPGGGEPSAVKSDFCSVSVSATDSGVTAGLFMPRTLAVRRNAPCRAVAHHRLFPSAHGLDNMHFPNSSWPHLAGGHPPIDNQATARTRGSSLQGCRRAETRRHESERQ